MSCGRELVEHPIRRRITRRILLQLRHWTGSRPESQKHSPRMPFPPMCASPVLFFHGSDFLHRFCTTAFSKSGQSLAFRLSLTSYPMPRKQDKKIAERQVPLPMWGPLTFAGRNRAGTGADRRPPLQGRSAACQGYLQTQRDVGVRSPVDGCLQGSDRRSTQTGNDRRGQDPVGDCKGAVPFGTAATDGTRPGNMRAGWQTGGSRRTARRSRASTEERDRIESFIRQRIWTCPLWARCRPCLRSTPCARLHRAGAAFNAATTGPGEDSALHPATTCRRGTRFWRFLKCRGAARWLRGRL